MKPKANKILRLTSADELLKLIEGKSRPPPGQEPPPLVGCSCRKEFEAEVRKVAAAGLSDWKQFCPKCGRELFWEWKENIQRLTLECLYTKKDGRWTPARLTRPEETQVDANLPETSLAHFRQQVEKEISNPKLKAYLLRILDLEIYLKTKPKAEETKQAEETETSKEKTAERSYSDASIQMEDERVRNGVTAQLTLTV